MNVAKDDARVGVQVGQDNRAQDNARVDVQVGGGWVEATSTPHPGWQVCDDCREEKTGVKP